MGREIYDVSFLYQFRETAEKSGGRGGIKEVDVECSMTLLEHQSSISF